MALEYRVVTLAAEVVETGTPAARVHTVAAEVVQTTTANARVAYVVAEVVRTVTTASGRRRPTILF